MISHFKGIKFRTGNQTMNEHVNISFILVFIFRFLFFCFVLFRIANVFLISHVQWILAFINISRIRNEEVTPSNNRSVILRVRSSPPELCFPLLAGYFLTLKEELNTSNDQDQTPTILSIVIPRVPSFKEGNLEGELQLFKLN